MVHVIKVQGHVVSMTKDFIEAKDTFTQANHDNGGKGVEWYVVGDQGRNVRRMK